LESLNQRLREDTKFKEEYVRWLKSQLFEYSPEMNERIAEQLAYMLMNRLTFYKTLETQMPSLQKLAKIETEDPKVFSERLREIFDRVCKDVDYEAIFETHTVLDQILLPKKLIYALNDFIEELGTYDLSKIRSDIIGRVYEELIPDVERHRLGQYYTPPPIVELITEMCIRSPNDKVLDPACGSGSFLVKAYHKLKDLKKKENPFADEDKLHEDILNQLYGIDINQFPAQLSSINLAIRNLKTASRHINILVSDFFKVKPSVGIFPKEVDVVVTNPPYTRQEEMEYKDQIREAALTYSNGTKIDIGAQAGIYAYFFTHSARFLKNGGRMGYITSNTWLDVSFGEGLKQFFLDHFKILVIIEHDAGAFEKANVDTCIVILEKAEGNGFQDRRSSNIVKFTRIKKAMEIGTLVSLIASKNANYENETIRLHLQNQGELSPKEKWGKYLRAPSIYYRILGNPNIISLGELAHIRRGFMTGANEFFILDKEKARVWGIEKKYLKSFIKSPRDAKTLEFSSKNVKDFVLMVHDEKNALDKNALKYIEQGEEKKYNQRQSLKSRRLWYDLGKRNSAPILLPYMIRKRARTIWNRANAFCPNVFHEATPKKEENIKTLLGILNSTPFVLVMELQGRLYGRGLLKIETYEWSSFPILNPDKISPKEKHRIEASFSKVCEAQNNGDEKLEQEARMELDNAVFDVLKLKENERKQVYEGLESLRRMRLQRKEVEVLVETAEKWKPVKKPKKERLRPVEPSKRLDTWMAE
jgi:type I restriction-modification system DNA methylase subunit